MDIQTKPPSPNTHHAYRRLLQLIHNTQPNMKRAAVLINRLQDSNQLYEILIQTFLKQQKVQHRVSWLQIILYLLQNSKQGRLSNSLKMGKMIECIYQVNEQIELYSQNDVQVKLQLLNRTFNVLKRIVTVSCQQQLREIKEESNMMHESLSQRMVQYCIKMIQQHTNTLILNQLLNINLLLHISQSTNNNTIPHIINQLLPQPAQLPSSPLHQQLYLDTFIKCQEIPLNITWLDVMSSMAGQLRWRVVQGCSISNYELIKELPVQSFGQLQLLTSILQREYEHNYEEQWCLELVQYQEHPLVSLWVYHCLHLLEQHQETNLATILPHNHILIIHIYLHIANTLSQLTYNNNTSFQLILIWKEMLLQPHIHDIIIHNKSLLINAQLTLYKYVRLIIQAQCQCQGEQMVLAVFVQYFRVMLLQGECRLVRQQLIAKIIKSHLQLLTEDMLRLRLDNRVNKKEYYNIINLEQYSQPLLNYIIELHMPSPAHIHSVLHSLNRKLSLLLLKHILHTKTLSISQLLHLPNMLSYTITTNIQIHLDQYEYIILQQLSTQLQHFIKAIYHHHFNIYKVYINVTLINFIMNQEYAGKQRLVKIDRYVLDYLTYNMEGVYLQLVSMNIQRELFVKNVIDLVIRSLYYNLLPHSYALIIAITAQNQHTNFSVSHLGQIIKFIKMNYHQPPYLYIAFSILFIALYGTAIHQQISPNVNILNQVLADNGYFVLKLMEMLGRDGFGQWQWMQPQQMMMQECCFLGLKRAILVNLMSGLMRHISNIKISTNAYSQQILCINKLIQELILTQQINILTITQNQSFHTRASVKKRQRHYSIHQQKSIRRNQQDHQQQPDHHPQITHYYTAFYELLQRYVHYDQIMEYKYMQVNLFPSVHMDEDYHEQRQVMALGDVERVGGKLRSIIHIKK